MIEHNNRKQADKFAEYITGQGLRQYLAQKVKHYVGDNPTVFDGAVGSGQLEQHLNAKHITGVEIQKQACDVFIHNYPNATVHHQSFFEFDGDISVDCVAMNPPFSIKFKDLPEAEQANIKAAFSWKKSGVVDDIFVLKSLKYAKRYAFYILFPGVAYRGTEKTFRELIGNQLAECNMIANAFDDTPISVLFIVIDKQKTDDKYQSEYLDLKTGERYEQDFTVDVENWQTARKPTPDPFGMDFDIDTLNDELMEADIAKLDAILSYHHGMTIFTGLDFRVFCGRMRAVIDKWSVV
ncbi:SAM-dependent methyltransferase [Moraxella haemolytica]|uniref:N-6 DNA methylase n=1 Tax=Moraxella haemolytica TaxID=2904119 RepID=UPI0025437113|nr:N-6 DNA methylase [Moraxella sp. ZY171148]WII95972.1 SAM-dependent methyltransferase [Moraxella sp. ZY171148]